jgi:hypothetical protein
MRSLTSKSQETAADLEVFHLCRVLYVCIESRARAVHPSRLGCQAWLESDSNVSQLYRHVEHLYRYLEYGYARTTMVHIHRVIIDCCLLLVDCLIGYR